jgi:tRNA-2-methylthio-N6-dimethylallyladenosine synthase
MNVCDSQWLSQALAARGWRPAPEHEAEVILVNTCSVRDKPEQKVYSLLGRLASSRRETSPMVGVGGCVAQQVGTAFWERFPQVRLVFGTDNVCLVPDSLEQLLENPGQRVSLLDFMDHYPERESVSNSVSQPAQAYVNIMQGCDNFCTYCIVPYTRGRQKSRGSGAVLQECRELVEAGVKEITLLGQNVNSFGQDRFGDGMSFAELIQEVCSIPGLARVRFTTSHPKDIDPALIEAFGRLDNLCPALHLPLQSGSDRILKRMGRKYSLESYLDTVRALRQACPGIVLSTDLIVGFPGETEADFQQTLAGMEEVGFGSSYSFKYSDRPGVKAASFSDKVDETTKSRRLEELQQLQADLTGSSLQDLVGRDVDVLVEGFSPRQNGRGPSWRGREPGGRVVNFSSTGERDLTGAVVRVHIDQAKKHSVTGEVKKSYG